MWHLIQLKSYGGNNNPATNASEFMQLLRLASACTYSSVISKVVNKALRSFNRLLKITQNLPSIIGKNVD